MNGELQKYNGLFITDFDGTLLRTDRTLADKDLETLQRLGDMNVVRVIATGRSLYSFNRTVGSSLPIDYIIFSLYKLFTTLLTKILVLLAGHAEIICANCLRYSESLKSKYDSGIRYCEHCDNMIERTKEKGNVILIFGNYNV